MSRRVFPFVALLSLLALAAVFVFRPLPTTITRENANRIQAGMEVDPVVAILGPPRNETSVEPDGFHLIPHLSRRRRWVGERLAIYVDTFYDFSDGEGTTVRAVSTANTEFPSTWDFVCWRAKRSLGLAPDRLLDSEPVL